MPDLIQKRLVRLGVLTTLIAAGLAAIATGGSTTTSSDSVRTALPVDGLGVDEDLVGYSAGCGELFAWWPARGRPTRVPREVTDCSGTGTYGDVAVASDHVVWVALEEHNHLYLGVHAARASNPKVITRLYEAVDEDVGGLAADGAVVAFSTQAGEYYSGPRATLWRGTTSRVAPLTRGAGWMDRVVVEGDVVALGYRDGRVRLFRTGGASIGSFDAGPVLQGLDLDQGRLLTLTSGRVSVTTPAGRVIVSRRVRGGGKSELLDSRSGLVVYRSGTALRLLRLTDGRDVAIKTPRTPSEYLHARFERNGLVIAHLAEASRPERGGIVKLLRTTELERLLAQRS